MNRHGIALPAKSKHFKSLKAAQSLHSLIGSEPRASPVIPQNTLLVSRSWPAFRLALFGLTGTGQPSLHRLALKKHSWKVTVLLHTFCSSNAARQVTDVLWPPKQSYLTESLPLVTLSLTIRNRIQLFRSIYRSRGSYIMWLTLSPSWHARAKRLHSLTLSEHCKLQRILVPTDIALFVSLRALMPIPALDFRTANLYVCIVAFFYFC